MSKTTTDHNVIRKWAERKGGKPAAVKRTHEGGDVGIIRIMFPNNPQSEHDSLVEISWDEFFEQFEESQLALIYEDDSLFSKLVGRETAERREHGDNHAARSSQNRSGSGGAEPSKRGSETEGQSLKAREYRDSEGNVHHHTNVYMEEHGKAKSGGRR